MSTLEARVRIRRRPPIPDTHMICEQIVGLSFYRRAAMTSRIAQRNNCTAVIMKTMSVEGILPSQLTEKQMKSVKVQIASVYDHIVKGSSLDAHLHPVAKLISPYILHAHQAILMVRKIEDDYTDRMCALAAQLPVYNQFIIHTRGVGLTILATIVAETGNLSNYRRIPKVWKRLGLAVMDGVCQGRGKSTARSAVMSDEERLARKKDWADRGYSGRRRSVPWNAASSLMRNQKKGDIYRDIYDRRKAYELSALAAQGIVVCGAGDKKPAAGVPVMALKHVDNRAKRVMEKVFLKHLYLAWVAIDPVRDDAPE